MPRRRDAVGNSRDERSSIGDEEIADELHDAVDLPRDLSSDLAGDLDDDLDDEEVWFEAEELAAASTIDLAKDPIDHLACAPDLEAIAAAIASPGISLARLPGWPEAGPTGQGLGELGEELIGELRPGDLVLFGAAGRGVGRTSLLAQLGDGLALAEAPGRPLTPVLCAIEGSPALWRARSLARFAGVDARVFVDAERSEREGRGREWIARFARGPWASLDRRQRFVDVRALIDRPRRAEILAALRRWQDELGAEAGEVWPIVIVDPLEQLADDPRALVDALATLAELAAAEALIVLASCDVHGREHARALDRHAIARLELAAIDEDTLAVELCHRRLGPRGGGRLRWHRASGRFVPDGCRPDPAPGY